MPRHRRAALKIATPLPRWARARARRRKSRCRRNTRAESVRDAQTAAEKLSGHPDLARKPNRTRCRRLPLATKGLRRHSRKVRVGRGASRRVCARRGSGRDALSIVTNRAGVLGGPAAAKSGHPSRSSAWAQAATRPRFQAAGSRQKRLAASSRSPCTTCAHRHTDSADRRGSLGLHNVPPLSCGRIRKREG